jgi:Zn-dependent alcohol dehydrogenase
LYGKGDVRFEERRPEITQPTDAIIRSRAAAPAELIDLITRGEIDPGRVFDLTLPLDQVPEGYRAMGERRAIKTPLMP